MPSMDMPLEQLREYRGCTPVPDNFEEYWNKAKKQAASIVPAGRTEPCSFRVPNAVTEDLYVTAADGSVLYAKVLRPNNAGRNPVMLMFHGYGCNSCDWSDKLAYVNAGFAVVALDMRGQGGKSEDRSLRAGSTFNGLIVRGAADPDPEKMYFRYAFTDLITLVNWVKAQPFADCGRMYAMGGSQGGALTIACAALCPDDIAACAPQIPFLCDYKRIYEMDLMKDAYYELFHYIRWYLPEDGERGEFWKRLGYVDIKNLAPRIKCEVLFGTGLMDTVCPPSAQFSVYNNIRAPKTHKLYSNFGHEWLPGFNDEAYLFFCKKAGLT